MAKIETKRRFLKDRYRPAYDKWLLGVKEKNIVDDRMVYCATYEILSTALDVMETIDNNFIEVAFNDKFRSETRAMDSILVTFREAWK